jgi:hypothetical protein
MSENILIAIIGAIVSIISSASLVNWRLSKLEEKVDKHNGYSDKIAKMQTDIALMQKDISWIKSAIEKLEREE